ncbi:MAG: aromatic amino acid transport family protein [Nanoarchaeota archaeon]|nr:aromatic amino acid transport family protein [Nanoarchaeota archaeon]
MKATRHVEHKIPFIEDPFIMSVALMIGMLIGAGILAMPYVIYQAGFWTGMLVLAFIGFAILFMHLYVGEVVLRTNGKHQLVGYVEKYLGKNAKHILTFSTIFMINGALIAYILGEGVALKSVFGGDGFVFSMAFFVIMAVLVFFSLKVLTESEVVIGLAMIIMVLLVCFLSSFYVDFKNFQGFDIKNFFIPYGIIFFAVVGGGAVPPMKALLEKRKKDLKKAILLGTLIPLGIYALFSIIVIGVVGENFNVLTQGVATVALGAVLGKNMNVFVNLFAVFSMATSFIAMALMMKWVYQYDYKMKKHLAWALTCIIPLILVLLNVTTFVRVLALIGAIGGGVEGIMIVLMHYKAKKMGDREPEYSLPNNVFISALLISVFVIGLVITVLM